MGYRSEWALAVEGTPEKIEAFRVWLATRKEESYKAKEDDPKYFSGTIGQTYETVINCFSEEVHLEGETVGLLYGHDFMKCYDPWDLVVEEISDFCTDNDIAFGYGRLGEEPGDVSMEDNDMGVHISWDRKLVTPFK